MTWLGGKSLRASTSPSTKASTYERCEGRNTSGYRRLSARSCARPEESVSTFQVEACTGRMAWVNRSDTNRDWAATSSSCGSAPIRSAISSSLRRKSGESRISSATSRGTLYRSPMIDRSARSSATTAARTIARANGSLVPAACSAAASGLLARNSLSRAG
ncbi:Uncharacterised protein [Mycobacteroides abscessus subsp. abscessus]|nr:Uncharacterised protein [Mycobacteroides abscessus subsp. abscessus]